MSRRAAKRPHRFQALLSVKGLPIHAGTVRPHQVQVHRHDLFRQWIVLRVLARVGLGPHRRTGSPRVDTYAMGFPEDQRKRAMKWLKMHAQYDDAHPWEALEIICTLAGENPTLGLRNELRKAICKSYDCMYLFLERCMQLEGRQQGRLRPTLAAG